MEFEPLVAGHQSALSQYHRLKQSRVRSLPQPLHVFENTTAGTRANAPHAAAAEAGKNIDIGRFSGAEDIYSLAVQPADVIHISWIPVVGGRAKLGSNPQALSVVEDRRGGGLGFLASIVIALPRKIRAGAGHVEIEAHTTVHRLRRLAIRLRFFHGKVERLVEVASGTQRTSTGDISGQLHFVATGIFQQRGSRRRLRAVRGGE